MRSATRALACLQQLLLLLLLLLLAPALAAAAPAAPRAAPGDDPARQRTPPPPPPPPPRLALVARDGRELGAALAALAQPGPPVVLELRGNVSMEGVPGPRPAVIARDVLLRGAGPPQGTELNLLNLVNRWRLAPGARLSLRNVTLSNLALRPLSAEPPPPANMSVFTYPLWFFQIDRRARADGTQLSVENCNLIVPYDEFVVLHHALVTGDAVQHGVPHITDMYSYYEHLIAENMEYMKCRCDDAFSHRGAVELSAAAGVGVVMSNVALSYKRNVFDVLQPRSMDAAAGRTAAGAPPPGGAALRPPLQPWAAAVAALGAALGAAAAGVVALAAWRRARRRRRGRRVRFADSLGGGSEKDILQLAAASASLPRPPSPGSGSAGGGGASGGGSAGLDRPPSPRTQSAPAADGGWRRRTMALVPASGTEDAPPPPAERAKSAPSYPTARTDSGSGRDGVGGVASGTAVQQLHAAVAELNREIDDKSLIIHEVLGQGAYGTVYRGTWRNLPVAVKTVVFQDRAAGGEKAQTRAITEAAITASVSHPNVVATLSYDLQPLAAHGGGGLSVFGAPGSEQVSDWKLFLVQEFCNGGSLRQAVDGRLVLWDEAAGGPNMREILSAALDIATGMEHIHSKQIVHGDLTPNNVLLHVVRTPALPLPPGLAALGTAAGPQAGAAGGAAHHVAAELAAEQAEAGWVRGGGGGGGGGGAAPAAGAAARGPRVSSPGPPGGAREPLLRSAKIADFGLSVRMPEGASHISNLRQGTPFYVAPEVLHRGSVTKAADVYSFGVLLWEMYQGKPPYRRSRQGGFALRRGFPFFEAPAPRRFAQLAAACMAESPRGRPGFGRVKEELLELLRTQLLEEQAVRVARPGPPAAAAAPPAAAAGGAGLLGAAQEGAAGAWPDGSGAPAWLPGGAAAAAAGGPQLSPTTPSLAPGGAARAAPSDGSAFASPSDGPASPPQPPQPPPPPQQQQQQQHQQDGRAGPPLPAAGAPRGAPASAAPASAPAPAPARPLGGAAAGSLATTASDTAPYGFGAGSTGSSGDMIDPEGPDSSDADDDR
ncbi:MAG: hypothetical protein J3K34DRAFT_520076 [Monoraphidium minutum]|nr:MAG: hypothetical protein J3K34DRAFT_520076 [Monoraphidium minutum]